MSQSPTHTFTIGKYSFEVFDGDFNQLHVICNDDGEHKYMDTFSRKQFSIAQIMEHYAAIIHDDGESK
jgi:hypothetical protein